MLNETNCCIFLFNQSRVKRNRIVTWLPLFPALGTRYRFSRAWHSVCSIYMFSRAWNPLHLFLRLAAFTCFPALVTHCLFSRAWYWVRIYRRLVHIFSRPWHLSVASVCVQFWLVQSKLLERLAKGNNKCRTLSWKRCNRVQAWV